jgi:hypothetical protein
MTERGALLPTLDRLFAGPRESVLTIEAFLQGLENRSYAFAVLALNVPNCVPTNIPWVSTITGVPMLLLVGQYFLGYDVPSLPDFVGRRGLPRGRLQDFLAGRARRWIERLENAIHPRLGWWLTGLPRRLLLLTWTLLIVLLALPVPFDNLIPAWAIMFFCMALLERDGVMAMLGWLFTGLTIGWTIFLLTVGIAVGRALLNAIF